jgi:ribonucleoside-triphosphate reductase
MNDYQKFIAISRYARWIDEENRRETWEETVQRYVDYITEKVKGHLPKPQIIDAITKLEVMPSMRALMTAGPALERDNTAGYNCSYLPVDDPKAFDEAMYILLCGTGVGFSVERQYVSQLPEIPQTLDEVDTVIHVQDSKEGWARALRKLIGHLYMGEVPMWDTSKVRPAGARLKVFGGRASGPAPLIDLFNFTVALFRQNAGRKLSSYDCHNLVSGGRQHHRWLCQTTLLYTLTSLMERHSYESGHLLLSLSQVNVVYLIEYLQRNKQRSLAEEMLIMSLVVILAVRLYLDPISSAILQRL